VIKEVQAENTLTWDSHHYLVIPWVPVLQAMAAAPVQLCSVAGSSALFRCPAAGATSATATWSWLLHPHGGQCSSKIVHCACKSSHQAEHPCAASGRIAKQTPLASHLTKTRFDIRWHSHTCLLPYLAPLRCPSQKAAAAMSMIVNSIMLVLKLTVGWLPTPRSLKIFEPCPRQL